SGVGIVVRLLGAGGWRRVSELRAERRTGGWARLLYEVLGEIWVVRRNPYLQEDLLDNPRRRSQLVEALEHRIGEIERRREADAGLDEGAGLRSQRVARLVELAREAVREFERLFEQVRELRQRAVRQFARLTAADNVRFDPLARVSHVTDATDWRVEYPFVVLNPDSEREVAGLVLACV